MTDSTTLDIMNTMHIKKLFMAAVLVLSSFAVQAQDVIISRKTTTTTTTSTTTVPKPKPNKPSPTDFPGQTFTANGVSFKMILVEGGTFTMGATDEDGEEEEEPTHRVTLSSYYISETEVTQALWEAVMGTTISQQHEKALSNKSNTKDYPLYNVGDNHPMYYVSWDECQSFIQRLDSLTGRKFHLPTEAEWEFAARGGKRSKNNMYSGGNLYTIRKVMWCESYNKKGELITGPHPVKTKAPNELGIYDMSGNVAEWCQDWFGPYTSSSQTNPTGPETGTKRVTRGGDWMTYPHGCRVAFRREDVNYEPFYSSFRIGFRLALNTEQ